MYNLRVKQTASSPSRPDIRGIKGKDEAEVVYPHLTQPSLRTK